MYRAFHYPPGRERLHAIGALDLALWDLKGKALDVPVYELLGGLNRNYLECYTTTFRGGGNTLRDRAAACMQAGWRLFRFDAASVRGHQHATTRANACGRCRPTAGRARRRRPGRQLHGRLSPAVHACRRAPRLQDDRGVRARISSRIRCRPIRSSRTFPSCAAMTIVPLAAGEEWGARWDFHRLVENHDLDFVRCSLPNVGGITEMIRICASARRTTSASSPISPARSRPPRRSTRSDRIRSPSSSSTTTARSRFRI